MRVVVALHVIVTPNCLQVSPLEDICVHHPPKEHRAELSILGVARTLGGDGSSEAENRFAVLHFRPSPLIPLLGNAKIGVQVPLRHAQRHPLIEVGFSGLNRNASPRACFQFV